MTIDDKIEDEEMHKQPSIWDSLVAAYSSSRAVKTGLVGLNYSYALAAISSIAFYATARGIGTAIKMAYKLITFQYSRMMQIYNDMKSTFNPLGKVKRSTVIGGTLGLMGGLTGA